MRITNCFAALGCCFLLAAGMVVAALADGPATSSPPALEDDAGKNPTSHKVTKIADLSYYQGEDADPEKHKLDLYLPAGAKNFPILLWIHGGAWAAGDRSGEESLSRRFAEAGVGVAAMSYRLSPGAWMNPRLSREGVQHPAHIEDVARAFAWLHKHAAQYGYDQGKMLVSGYSAGGHLSALLATDPRYLKAEGLSTGDLRAVVPIAGAYELESYYRFIEEGISKDTADAHVYGVFGTGDEKLRAASPTTYLAKASIPMLVISESQTHMYTRTLEEAVSEHGIANIEFLHAADRDHASLLASLGRAGDETREKIIAYITRICGDS